MSSADFDLPPSQVKEGTAADEYLRRAGKGTSGAAPKGSPRTAPSRPSVPRAAAPPLASEDDTEPLKLTPKLKTLHASLMEFYTAAQMAVFMFDPITAESIRVTKEACVDAWIELARRDTKVMAMLTRITTGGAWGGVIMAHASLFVPIMARKGIIPGGALFGARVMNAMDPDVMDPEPVPSSPVDPFAQQGFVPAS